MVLNRLLDSEMSEVPESDSLIGGSPGASDNEAPLP